MNEQLLASAQKLIFPPEKACEEFRGKISMLVTQGNTIIAAHPDIDSLLGADNQEMAENNNSNFASFMESMFTEYDSATIVETVDLPD